MAGPGDGVCPSKNEFSHSAQRGYITWKSRFSEPENGAPADIVDEMVELLRDVPPFPSSRKRLSLVSDKQMLHAKCVSEWRTSTDPGCDKRLKEVRHFEVIGYREPLFYQYPDDQSPLDSRLGTQVKPFEKWCHLIYAWSYVLCMRWVELLSDSGEEAYLRQATALEKHNFWEIVLHEGWEAVITRNKTKYFAPWSLSSRPSGNNTDTAQSLNVIESPRKNHVALDALGHHVLSEGLLQEASIALAVTLTLAQRNGPIPAVLRVRPLPPPFRHFDSGGTQRHILFERLDSSITLSCAHEGISSILCSDFFDARVPCNLVGGHLCGVMEAIDSTRHDVSRFLSGIRSLKTCTRPLWIAAMLCDTFENVLNNIRGGLWPVKLPVATWTGTFQSFLQDFYSEGSKQRQQLSRAEENLLLFCARDDATPPLCPHPPLGETNTENLSLDVRPHLYHGHFLREYKLFWALADDDKLPSRNDYCPLRPRNLEDHGASNIECTGGTWSREYEKWQNISKDITFDSMRWQGNLEGGLWLQHGSETPEETHKRTYHPWIRPEPDSESDESVKSDESRQKAVASQAGKYETIERWLQESAGEHEDL